MQFEAESHSKQLDKLALQCAHIIFILSVQVPLYFLYLKK